MSLLPLAGLGVVGAETEMGVGLERVHAELLSQGERLAAMGYGLFDMGRLALRRDLAEEAEGQYLMAPFVGCMASS